MFAVRYSLIWWPKVNKMNAVLKIFSRLCLTCAFSVSIISCDSGTVQKDGSEPVVKADYAMLEGKWADLSGENAFHEIWHKAESGWRGTGLVLSKGDTVFIEHLSIEPKGNSWQYAVRIDGQNDDLPVFFRASSLDSTGFTFENRKHDFPQKIVYHFSGQDFMMITISGTEADSIRTEHFKMRRKN